MVKNMAEENDIRCIRETRSDVRTFLLGPFLVNGDYAKGEYNVPFATNELPLIKAINRGRKVVGLSGGVKTFVVQDMMTRAPMFECRNVEIAGALDDYIKSNEPLLAEIADATTGYGKLTSLETAIGVTRIGDEKTIELHLRGGMETGDAAGHNMLTKAMTAVAVYLEKEFVGVRFASISGNFCTDKKWSYINMLRGRGKSVYAEATIPRDIFEDCFEMTPESLVRLHNQKNITGSQLAGMVGSQNSHHGNIVAAIYLATGQDMANVTEGSMGCDSAVVNSDGSLTFGVYVPCLIMGTVGPGQRQKYATRHLMDMDCYGTENFPGYQSRKAAEISTAAVLGGELSTLVELHKGAKFFEGHEEERQGL